RNRVPLTRAALMRRDNYKCAYCGRHGETIDHVLPRSRGGQHAWENCVTACYPSSAGLSRLPPLSRKEHTGASSAPSSTGTPSGRLTWARARRLNYRRLIGRPPAPLSKSTITELRVLCARGVFVIMPSGRLTRRRGRPAWSQKSSRPAGSGRGWPAPPAGMLAGILWLGLETLRRYGRSE